MHFSPELLVVDFFLSGRKLDARSPAGEDALSSEDKLRLSEALTSASPLKNVLKCFGDQSERCRVVAVRYAITYVST